MMKRLLFALAIIAIIISARFDFFIERPVTALAQTNTFCAANLACTVTAAWTYSSSLTVNGTGAFTGTTILSGTANTIANLNSVIWVCNTVYACTDAGLQAAQNALTSGGTIVIPPTTGPTISNTVNITNPNITIMGSGPGSSIQVALAGDVFNVTNSRFRLHDLEIGLPTTTRTGAIIHASSSGAVLGSAYILDVVGSASSTNNGHFFLMDTANANQWDFDKIYMPRGTTWTTAFKFVNSSVSATASTFAIKEFRGGATFTDAGLVADGAIDTVQVIQSTWNSDGGSGKSIWIRNTVAGFINPRFIYFNQVSNEATDGGGHTSVVMQVDAGRQVHYNNGYCANTTNCFVIGASAIDTDISHNTAATIQQSFATVASGALRTIFIGNDIQDTSQQASNTFDTFAIAAGATDVTVKGNIQGCSGAIFPRYMTSVGAGGGDRIRILDNSIPPSCTGSAVVNNQGSGADIVVANNTQLANNFPFRLGESGAPSFFANQDTCYGDNTLHMAKCSYNNLTAFPLPLTGNTAGTHSDSGFYQTAGAAGCTTAASIGGVCATPITITWPVAFADANYKLTCTPIGPATNLPSTPYVVTPIAASVTINYFAITAAAASWPTVNCTAVHN